MNSKIIIGIISFGTGAIVGAVVSAKLVAKKKDAEKEEEINSVIETFKKELSEVTEESEESEEVVVDPEKLSEAKTKAEFCRNKPELKSYSEVVQRNDYNGYSNKKKVSAASINVDEDEEPEDPEDEINLTPQIIDYEDWDTNELYDQKTLTYFKDGTLIDEDNESVVEDPVDIVGTEFADNFINNVAYVRNDKYRIDYEILQDLRTYPEFLGESDQDEED